MLYEFLVANRETIIERARLLVATRQAPRATPDELAYGVPLFLDQLVEVLRVTTSTPHELVKSAAKHGEELLRHGFTIAMVVHDYGDVCQAVTQLAEQQGAEITAGEFRMFNGCLDDAIAGAVTEYNRLRDHSFEARETERLGALAHEVRNCLSGAMLSFQMLQAGKVAIRGSTGAVLERNLRRMRELIARTLAEVRIDAGIVVRNRMAVAPFVEDLEVAATMDARARGLQLLVTPVPRDVDIEADDSLVTAAVTNLLQNAFKFTRAGGQVLLRTTVTADRVAFEVEDECGGLPPHAAAAMFRPFEQHGHDRSGMGLGLSISKRAVEASGGELRVRDLPGKGCVFTIEFPRMPPATRREANEPDATRPRICPRTVLVVENEVDVARAMREILTLEGHDVHTAHDGAAALAAAPALQPDVVLLDLGLPTMDGYAVCKALRPLLRGGALIVALTAYQEDRDRLDQAGFDAYLVKPIDIKALLAMLATSGAAPPAPRST
jgi:signal transduction histidine kinase/ActR/RegA family two-component response regulator